MAGVVSGLAIRLASLLFFARNAKVGGFVCGLWDGVALHESLRRSRRRSTNIWNDPYNTIAMNNLLDFLLLGSLVRLAALLLGCGLGVILADIIPQVLEDSGFKAAFDDLSRMQVSSVFGRFTSRPGSASHYNLVVDPDVPRSPRSLSGSLTPTGAAPYSYGYSRAPSVVSSVLPIPGSFRRRFSGRSTSGSVISRATRPAVPIRPPEPNFATHPSPIFPLTTPISTEWEPDALPVPSPDLEHAEFPIGSADVPELEIAVKPDLLDLAEIPAEDMAGDASGTPPNDGAIGEIDDDFDESVVRPPGSVDSQTFGNVLLNQANEFRREATAAYARRDELEQQRKEAEAAGKPYEAFALKCQRDEAEEYGNKLNKRANSRYFAVRNAKKGPYSIDVHGLQEQEAIRRTERKLRDIQLDGGGSLRVITGNGDHAPVLKLSIMQEMQKQKLPTVIDQENEDVLVISIA